MATSFFLNPFFVLDMIVVGGALILEMVLYVKEGALLVLLLLWRLGRIVHGLVTTIEIGHKKMHAKINLVVLKQLERKKADVKMLKEHFSDLMSAKKELERCENLLKPSGLTVTDVDTASVEDLRRTAKLQMANNHDVVDILERLRESLTTVDDHIEGHLSQIRRETTRLQCFAHGHGHGDAEDEDEGSHEDGTKRSMSMKSSDPPVKPAKKAGLMGLMMDVKTGAMPVTRSPSRKDDPPSTVEDIDEEHPFAPCEPPAAEKKLGNNGVGV